MATLSPRMSHAATHLLFLPHTSGFQCHMKQPQSITEPPPCFTVGRVLFSAFTSFHWVWLIAAHTSSLLANASWTFSACYCQVFLQFIERFLTTCFFWNLVALMASSFCHQVVHPLLIWQWNLWTMLPAESVEKSRAFAIFLYLFLVCVCERQ